MYLGWFQKSKGNQLEWAASQAPTPPTTVLHRGRIFCRSRKALLRGTSVCEYAPERSSQVRQHHLNGVQDRLSSGDRLKEPNAGTLGVEGRGEEESTLRLPWFKSLRSLNPTTSAHVPQLRHNVCQGHDVLLKLEHASRHQLRINT